FVAARRGRHYARSPLAAGAPFSANYVLAAHGPAGHTFHVFMSHVHWDHIMGFPFFLPIYTPSNRIRIYGCHAELEDAFRGQHAAPCFPVDFSELSSRIAFVRLYPLGA